MNRFRSRRRRGTIYLAVLGTAMVIATLGLAALLTVRVERRMRSDSTDVFRAQFNARTGLQMGLYQVANNANWRTQMAAGNWNSDFATGQGTYRFIGTDPVDGNLTSSPKHPVIIKATGKSGGSTQMLCCQVDFHNPGLSCLEGAMHASNTIIFTDAAVAADKFISSNNTINAKGTSAIRADCSASVSVTSSGGTYYGTNLTSQPARSMPDSAALISQYTSVGTSIDFTSLPFCDRTLLSNGDFEILLTGWSGQGCTIVQTILGLGLSHGGTSALLVTTRSSGTSSPVQSVSTQIQSGESYDLSAWVKVTSSSATDSFRCVLTFQSTGTASTTLTTGWQAVPLNAWTEVRGSVTPTWSGTLTSATISLETQTRSANYYVDDYTMKGTNAPLNCRDFQRVVLSPNSNPWGGATNAQGVYVIDCANQQIRIKNCRIVGTLVLLNQSAQSELLGGIFAAPAVNPRPNVTTTTYPVIVSNKGLAIHTNSTTIEEGLVNVNLNPTGTAYRGSTNTSLYDSYPSEFRGVVYSAGNTDFAVSPTVRGMVVVDGKIDVTGTLTLDYDGAVYYEKNAPDGFSAGLVPFITPGSLKQVVN